MAAPRLVVLAGPNGAGKTTTAPSILRDALSVREFVNADTIASGLSTLAADAAAIRAGRIMLDRNHELARQRADFAFETTLASRSFRATHLLAWLPKAAEWRRIESKMQSSGKNSNGNGREDARRRSESDRIIAAVRKATSEAVRVHKQLGNPIAVSRDGKVVILPPEEIPDSRDGA